MQTTGKGPIVERVQQPRIERRVICGMDIATTPDTVNWVQAVLLGRYGRVTMPCDRGVRRVLDIGAGVGEFALWASSRWPGCWVDCIEWQSLAQSALRENVPLGTAVITAEQALEGEGLSRYQAIRVANVMLLFRMIEAIREWKLASPATTVLVVDVLAWGGQ